jgi:hypothetical protein
MRVFHVLLGSLLTTLALPYSGACQESVVLGERFTPGFMQNVHSRTALKGELTLPADKGKTPEKVEIVGRSSIHYDERLLPADGKTAEQKSLRIYREIDFKRLVTDRQGKIEKQEVSLRPEVRRQVVLRKGHAKVPFSPDGPLTWGEIDMLRTDLYTPALAGLLPGRAVKPGDTWQATAAAVAELTDMDKIEEGGITCKYELEEVIGGNRVAHVTLHGDLRGVNEDGPNRQKLTGRLYFDLRGSYVSYLSINGEHFLLDKDGKVNGRMTGEFVLVRRLNPRNLDLADDAVAKTAVEPTAENTLLLFEDLDLGVSFRYPRRWRVGRVQVNQGQITLDETNGSGLLITVDALAKIPSAPDYQREVQGYLKEQKATVTRVGRPDRVAGPPNELDRFDILVETGGQKALMEYLIARQPNAGATFAARLLETDRDALAREVERIARSLTLKRKLGEK